ncbi:hypothetical protein FRC01_000612 [Tulasnella sp. 417]|nr:hypothetical protein FRC01_000612 [Tulasnella sp. 417]
MESNSPAARRPGFVFSWLARRRQRKVEQATKAPLRRRASFPVYKPLGSAPANTTAANPNNNPNLAFNSVRGHHTRTISANATTPAQYQPIQQIHQQMQQQHTGVVPTAAAGTGGLYVPPGYVYKTTETRVGNRRVTVSAGAYPGHFAPQTGAPSAPAPNAFTPSHTRTASAPPAAAYQVYANVQPVTRTVAAGGSVKSKKTAQAPPPQPQYYYDPRATTTPAIMTQVPNTTPVTIAQTSTSAPQPKTSTTAPQPRTSTASATNTRRQAPAPPSTPRRKSARTPLSSQPQQEQVVPPLTPVTTGTRVSTGAMLAPPAPTSRAPATTSSASKRVSTGRRHSTPAGTSQPYNSSPRKVVDAYNRYSAFWKGAYSPRTLTFSSVPWPVVDAPKHPTSLNVNAVRSFLLSPHHSQGVPARERVEHAQSVWEPKSFMATYGPKMREDDKEKIERTLLFLQGTLRILYNEVVAAESMDDGSA